MAFYIHLIRTQPKYIVDYIEMWLSTHYLAEYIILQRNILTLARIAIRISADFDYKHGTSMHGMQCSGGRIA